ERCRGSDRPFHRNDDHACRYGQEHGKRGTAELTFLEQIEDEEGLGEEDAGGKPVLLFCRLFALAWVKAHHEDEGCDCEDCEVVEGKRAGVPCSIGGIGHHMAPEDGTGGGSDGQPAPETK